MSGAVLNSRFLTRLLTSGEEDIEHVAMLNEDIWSTACEVTVLTLSISVTVAFHVTCLTVAHAWRGVPTADALSCWNKVVTSVSLAVVLRYYDVVKQHGRSQ